MYISMYVCTLLVVVWAEDAASGDGSSWGQSGPRVLGEAGEREPSRGRASRERERARVEKWESRSVGKGESGRAGEWESGKVVERESGRVGEWAVGRVGKWTKRSQAQPCEKEETKTHCLY